MLGEASAERRLGTEIAGKYRLDRVLGAGGMGVVFQARHRWTHADVAVKLMLASGAVSVERTERFIREARLIAGLDHPNVVRVLDMGQDADGVLYIAYELLEGYDLEKHLAEELVLSPASAAEVLLPVMRALVLAHAKGIVHRDIKPANIVLTRRAEGAPVPKLIDFGVARLNTPESATATQSGMVLGTPAYMSPEQARGDSSVDAQSDVWSVGAMMFELLSGRRPFEGANGQAVLAAVLTSDPTTLDAAAPGISSAIVDVVHRALQRDRRERYASMAEFVRAIETCAAFNATTAPTRSGERTRRDFVTAAGDISVSPKPAARATPVALIREDKGIATLSPTVSKATVPRRRWTRRRVIATSAALLVVACGIILAGPRMSGHRPTMAGQPFVPSQSARLQRPMAAHPSVSEIADGRGAAARARVEILAATPAPPATVVAARDTPTIAPTIAAIREATRSSNAHRRLAEQRATVAPALAQSSAASPIPEPRPTHPATGANNAPLLDPLSQE